MPAFPAFLATAGAYPEARPPSYTPHRSRLPPCRHLPHQGPHRVGGAAGRAATGRAPLLRRPLPRPLGLCQQHPILGGGRGQGHPRVLRAGRRLRAGRVQQGGLQARGGCGQPQEIGWQAGRQAAHWWAHALGCPAGHHRPVPPSFPNTPHADSTQDVGISDWSGVAAVLCGQKGMAEAVTALLSSNGVPKERILTNF